MCRVAIGINRKVVGLHKDNTLQIHGLCYLTYQTTAFLFVFEAGSRVLEAGLELCS